MKSDRGKIADLSLLLRSTVCNERMVFLRSRWLAQRGRTGQGRKFTYLVPKTETKIRKGRGGHTEDEKRTRVVGIDRGQSR